MVENILRRFSRAYLKTPAVQSPNGGTVVRRQHNTGSSAQAAMLLTPPEGMAMLQEPFQHFLLRSLCGVLASNQLQQGVCIVLCHSS